MKVNAKSVIVLSLGFVAALSTGCQPARQGNTESALGSQSQSSSSAGASTPSASLLPGVASVAVAASAAAAADPVFTLPVVSAASYKAAIAPGSLASLFGEGGAFSDSVITGTAPYPQQLGGVRVYVDSIWAKLLFVAPNQINFFVPEMAPGVKSIAVYRDGGLVVNGTITVSAVAPGIFTVNDSGIGTPKAQAYDHGSYARVFNATTGKPRAVSAGTASDPNLLVLYGTGWKGRSSLGNVQVSFDGLTHSLSGGASEFAGAQGYYDGLDQLNVRIPPSIAGAQPKIVNVRITADGQASNWVRVCIAGTAGGTTCPMPTPARLVNVYGTGQVTLSGYTFADPMTVRVEDGVGYPIEGYPIHWSEVLGNFAAGFDDKDTVTNAQGVAISNGRGNGGAYAEGYLDTELGASLTLPDGGTLSTRFKVSSINTNTSGIIGINGDIDSPYYLTVSAGSVVPAAIVGKFFHSVSPVSGQPYKDVGLRVYLEPYGTSKPIPEAHCIGGEDESHTILSKADGFATCDLQVGLIKGTAFMKAKGFGAIEKTIVFKVE